MMPTRGGSQDALPPVITQIIIINDLIVIERCYSFMVNMCEVFIS